MKERYLLKLEPSLMNLIRDYASAHNRTIVSVITEALVQYFAKREVTSAIHGTDT